MRETLHKSELLRGRGHFQDLFEKGKSHTGKHLRYFILERGTDSERSPGIVVGFVVRRTVKRAVDRNRIKRLLRESYRKNKFILLTTGQRPSFALSIVFMYAPRQPIPVRSVTLAMLDVEMKAILEKISGQYRA